MENNNFFFWGEGRLAYNLNFISSYNSPDELDTDDKTKTKQKKEKDHRHGITSGRKMLIYQ